MQNKLTDPQRAYLATSVRIAHRDGKTRVLLHQAGMLQKTCDHLRDGGYVMWDYEHSEEERTSMEAERDQHIAMATAKLNAGDLKAAHAILSLAYNLHTDSERLGYILTESGVREGVEAAASTGG